MNTKHTPGPWHLWSNGDDCARDHAICSGPIVIAKVYGLGYPVGKGWSEQSAADARLIAKAPEMLALLRECVTPFRAAVVHDTIRALLAEIDGGEFVDQRLPPGTPDPRD